MTDDFGGATLVSSAGPKDLAQGEKRAGLIRLSSRVGVWGLIGGMVPVIAAAFEVGVPLGLAATMMGIGVSVSGLGITTASWLILRELRGQRHIMKWAAVSGLPLGLALTLYGVTQLSNWTPLVRSLGTIGPAALLFGALVALSLVIGFFRQWNSEDNEERDCV